MSFKKLEFVRTSGGLGPNNLERSMSARSSDVIIGVTRQQPSISPYSLSFLMIPPYPLPSILHSPAKRHISHSDSKVLTMKSRLACISATSTRRIPLGIWAHKDPLCRCRMIGISLVKELVELNSSRSISASSEGEFVCHAMVWDWLLSWNCCPKKNGKSWKTYPSGSWKTKCGPSNILQSHNNRAGQRKIVISSKT